MAQQVSNRPSFPNPFSLNRIQDITSYLQQLVNTLTSELSSHAFLINNALINDSSNTNPVYTPSYAKANLPSAATWITAIIYVPDDIGGAVLAFSDGTNWRRVTDRNIIS